MSSYFKFNNYNDILQLGINNQPVGLNQQLRIRLIKLLTHMHTSNLVLPQPIGNQKRRRRTMGRVTWREWSILSCKAPPQCANWESFLHRSDSHQFHFLPTWLNFHWITFALPHSHRLHQLHTVTMQTNLSNPLHFDLINTTQLTKESHKIASPSKANPSSGSTPTWHNFLP